MKESEINQGRQERIYILIYLYYIVWLLFLYTLCHFSVQRLLPFITVDTCLLNNTNDVLIRHDLTGSSLVAANDLMCR